MLDLQPVLQSNQTQNPYYYFLEAPIRQWDQYKKEVVDFAVTTFKRDFDPSFGYNVMLAPEKFPLIDKLYDDFVQICHRNFTNLQLAPRNKKVMWAYVQNKERFNSVWHNHKHSTTINAVWYPSIPDPTGTLAIRDGEGVSNMPVKEGYIYFWPYWMDHKPNPQLHSNEYRVSINIELLAVTRPIVTHNGASTGVMW